MQLGKEQATGFVEDAGIPAAECRGLAEDAAAAGQAEAGTGAGGQQATVREELEPAAG